MAVCKCSHGVFKRTDGNIQVQRWHYSGKISKLVQPRQCSSAVMTVFMRNHESIQVQTWQYSRVQPWQHSSAAIAVFKCSRGDIQVQLVISAALGVFQSSQVQQYSSAVFKCSHGSIQVHS